MNKPPAFQFYPGDFLSSYNVQMMEYDEKGAYIVLLCHAWKHGFIPGDKEGVVKLLQWPHDADRLWRTVVQPCFVLGSTPGQFVNPRQERERLKQDKYREEQATKGRKSGELRRKKAQEQKDNEQRLNNGTTEAEPKLNPLVSSLQSLPLNSNLPKPKKTLVPAKAPNYSDSDFRHAILLRDKILENNPNHKFIKDTETCSWANDIRLMREQDGRKPEMIEKVIRAAMKDDFWKGNIRSGSKLRKQFDQLVEKLDLAVKPVKEHWRVKYNRELEQERVKNEGVVK